MVEETAPKKKPVKKKVPKKKDGEGAAATAATDVPKKKVPVKKKKPTGDGTATAAAAATTPVKKKPIKKKAGSSAATTASNGSAAPVAKKKPVKKKPLTFIYPSSNNPHKNNFRFLNAFVKAAKKTTKEIELYITIEKQNLDIPKNLKINFLGLIDHNELLFHLKKIEFLIFPSLRESFGLPLIEGIQANCKILCSNLNFANELISPSYFFNPDDEKSITDVILVALSNKNHPKSSIKIKNSIGLIFNRLKNV